MKISSVHGAGRRKFLKGMGTAAGLFAMNPVSALSVHARSYTVGQVMDLFIKSVPGAPLTHTVDKLKAGSRDTVVSGIVTSMFPTVEVIRKAIELKANFLIVHEPSYYNHLDLTDWLENNDVFRTKMDLLNKHGIAVWRNHDYAHSHRPDGVYEGFVDQSGWKQYYKQDGLFQLPATSLQSIIDSLKEKFATGTVRYIGDLSASCQSVLYMPGAPGGQRQIEAIHRSQPDVAICGEIQEWETAEYIRDARLTGKTTNLIVMGHVASEEPGSKWMAEWLKRNLTDIKVTHIASGNPFSTI